MSLEAHEPRKKYRDREYLRVEKANLTLKKGDKTVFSLSMKPSPKDNLFGKISRLEKNPDKISFGTITNYGNRLEFCAYMNTLLPNPSTVTDKKKAKMNPIKKLPPKRFLLFVNGEHITLDRDDWRKLFGILNKIGGYFGLQTKKRRKT